MAFALTLFLTHAVGTDRSTAGGPEFEAAHVERCGCLPVAEIRHQGRETWLVAGEMPPLFISCAANELVESSDNLRAAIGLGQKTSTLRQFVFADPHDPMLRRS